MECVILVRMESGAVLGIEGDEEGALEVFPDADAAIDFAEEHVLCKAMPWQLVELDEL